jgi:peptide/nickel transport system substrate-binding protein
MAGHTRFGMTLLAATLALWLGRGTGLAGEEKAGTPQYGGTLNVGPVYITLSALTWDPADFTWKVAQDTGPVYEQLFAADLSKAEHNGGKYPFVIDGYLPPGAIRGELAESWEWKQDPLRVEIKLREGVMFPDKAGLMKSRELTADDVVNAYNRLNASPKNTTKYFDHNEKVEATGQHTVVFTFKHYFGEWDYRFGYGYFSGIYPKEASNAGLSDWKHVTGSGPFMLSDFVAGNSDTYTRNPHYWGKETIGGKDYKLPFVDKVVYYTIKDEATWIAALRTGKLDLLETISWQNVDSLKKSAPQLQWHRWLSTLGTFLAMRVDVDGPFKDLRVRRALNMAVNKQEIVTSFYNGNAELFAYPEHPDFGGYFEPLETMPDSVKELFTYNPEKAKQLLAEAGYPNGFTFKVMVCACAPVQMDLLPLLAAYLEQVGVKIEIQPMEYAAFYSAMVTRTMTPGYFMSSGIVNPTTTLRKSFTAGQQYNPSGWSDPAFTRRLDAATAEPDDAKRQEIIRALTREILDQAPYIWLPAPYVYTAWWPWVKNYGGELRAGAERAGPIYARIWIDQEMKKSMGY